MVDLEATDRGRGTFRAEGSPDIMNDPAYAPGRGGKGKAPDEADTCRICRGEGTEGDELFYPCKCSGSIKFVHQGCLMEWLSHSQKKYCELCKTPFRFTKLYDPDMPQELPAPVFLKELVIHGSRSLVTWLRFALVTFVWLVWLPWSMRAVWRGLFWLADGRWPGPSDVYEANRTSGHLAALGTSPASSTLASNTPPTPTAVENIATAIPQLLSPVSSILNFTAGEPLIYSVAKSFFSSAFVASTTSADASGMSPANTTAPVARRLRQPSWLSDITFLNTLTPYPTVNNIIIDTLEGQLITLLVVISFILVFLIREWVVQQQPVLNIAEGEREAAAQLMADERILGQEDQAHDDDIEEDTEIQETGQLQRDDEDEAANASDPAPEFGPLPSTEFNVPDPDSSRPVFPSTSADHGAITRSNSDDERRWPTAAADGGHQIITDRREQRGSGNSPLINTSPSDAFWNAGENISDSPRITEFEDRQDTLVSATLPNAPTTHTNRPRRGSESSGKQKKGNGETFTPPQSGFDISLPSAQPKSPLFRGNFGDEVQGPSQPFTFSSQVRQTLENDLEPISPGPSRVVASSDSSSDSASDDGLDPLHLPNGLSDSMDPELPLTPISLDRTSNDGIEGGTITPNAEPELEQNIDEPMEADERQGLVEEVANWFWGDIPVPFPPLHNDEDNDDDDDDDENGAPDPPFVRMRPRRDGNLNIAQGDRDPGVGPAAPGLGGEANEAEAVDDADDLEGIMELIGMQGPIFGLLQNGVFSALLISFTVSVGIWLPYLWGKIGLVLLTNPVRFLIGVPLTVVSIIAGIAADTFIGSFAYAVYLGNLSLRMLITRFGTLIPALQKLSGSNAVTSASMSLMEGSGQRLKRVIITFLTFHESDLPMFSVLSRQALRIHEARIAAAFRFLLLVTKTVTYDLPLRILTADNHVYLLRHFVMTAPGKCRHAAVNIVNGVGDLFQAILGNVNLSYLKTVNDGIGSFSVDPGLACWNTRDRVIAIVVGYCFATFVGLAYLRASAILGGTHRQQRVNGAVADALRQAGGVMKVILIIGIEMIIFPLYCGILLDIALLPLFETATVMSRLNFTLESPMTSLFVHWFVGTCYMFHFALFVSMCRKILRSGVLYFIRDPDDPTFHPVRDVLERSIATQLRKIAFSALVYGALVIICLGGVVWGLSFALKEVLPLHWSSNEPVLEFPVDLLFYNFVVPLAIRSIKPSDTLHQMYDWWFHRCARVLRLTAFLFGDRRQDEEGKPVIRTWYDMFLLIGSANTISPEAGKESGTPSKDSEDRRDFVRDGRFVRTPASDQVRIPKGASVFLEVNEDNERLDGKPDRRDGLHGRANDMFAKVYVPPSFRARISTFIFLIWVFAAVTGVGTTVLPLLLGRRMISSLFPPHVRVNDIYAFSAGICVAGGLVYTIIHLRQALAAATQHLRPYSQSPTRILSEIWKLTCCALCLVYASGALVLFFPSVLALLTELYVFVPLHTFLYGEKAHVIHFVQDWTLGVLYLRMAIKFISWHTTSPLEIALHAVTRNGWLRPDMKLATRAFIVPAAAVALVALVGPLPFGYLVNATVFRQAMPAIHSQVYRYCYPAFLLAVLALLAVRWLRRQIGIWRVSIRDDVYLIGERLHNFGGRRPMDVGVPRRMMTS